MAIQNGSTSTTSEGINGVYKFKIEWEVNSQNVSTNKSNITVKYLGWTDYGNPAYSTDSRVRLYVGGSQVTPTSTSAIDFRNHPSTNPLVLATWTGDVTHPSGGGALNLSLKAELDWRNNQSSVLPVGVYENKGTAQIQAMIQSYKLYISGDSHSTPTVKRSGTTLSNGATINKGDVLTITFSANTGYSLTSRTVNGSTFTSGNTYTVGNSDVTVKCTSAINTYILSLSEGTNSSIIVQRNGETLYNGSPINYGDVLTVYFVVNTGYTLGTHTVNGSSFTSGNTHTVTGNVSVVSTASQSSYTLTISKGSNTNLTVKRGSTTLSNGATIHYGDVLTVTYSANSGYTITQATANDASISSGATYIVAGNTTVKTVATAQPYNLTINQGNNTKITVVRNNETLKNGDKVAYGDVLNITFTAATGYVVVVHTVNGSEFTSGNNYTVGNRDVAIVSTASTGASILQPTNIFPDVIYNSGVIDPVFANTFSWQVSGNATMVAYEIIFYKNDTASTFVATTGKVNLDEPFYGRDLRGNPIPFEVEFEHYELYTLGLRNGFEYKMEIRQWWSNTEYVEQLTPSVFKSISKAEIAVSNTREQDLEFITAQYIQSAGVPLNWLRWQAFFKDERENAVYDTGVLSNSNFFTLEYGDMIPNDSGVDLKYKYDFVFSGETAEGQFVSGTLSGANHFLSNYPYPFAGNIDVCQQIDGSVLISWNEQAFAQKYIIHRLNVENKYDYKKIAIVDNTTTSIVDYSAASDTDYVYYVFARYEYQDVGNLVGKKSEIIHTKFNYWKIIESHLSESDALLDTYIIDNVHYFKYGVSEGAFSNNNSPNILKNFTRYPTWQADSANYLSGSVSGYIGTVDVYKNYHDSISQSRRIFELSQTKKVLFLLDPEGNFLLIKVSSPISMNVRTNNTAMQKTMTIPWVEIGNTNGITLLSADDN